MSTSSVAEPYLAVRNGAKCAVCHTNPTGGGKRNQFGRTYGQSVLPSQAADKPFTELVNRYLDIGGNLRTNLNFLRIPNNENTAEFSTERANIYLEAKLIPERLTFYLDQQFSPASDNREAWILLNDSTRGLYFKAGKLFLPFGLRLEDDSAFIRATTGVNFANADNGIEAGLDKNQWSVQLALTNGTAGGAEDNTDKQISARVEYVEPTWRTGASFNTNNGSRNNSRDMLNFFAAATWMNAEWLFEVDQIEDSSPAEGEVTQLVTFLEMNRQLAAGQNLKLTLEFLDPDKSVAENHRNRISVVWEYTPLGLIQLRTGVRIAKGIPQNDAQNTDRLFMQLHAFF